MSKEEERKRAGGAPGQKDPSPGGRGRGINDIDSRIAVVDVMESCCQLIESFRIHENPNRR
jgi:hypothetical protein